MIYRIFDKKKRKKKAKRGALMLALIFSVLLSSCSGEMPVLSAPQEETVDLTESRDVYLAMRMVHTLNPLVSTDEDSYHISALIYDSLFELGEDLAAVPQLADEYEYLRDGYALKIKLKRGIRWQDGEELSAKDVKFTIDCLKTFYYEGRGIYGDYVSNIGSVGLDGEDALSLTIYFNNRNDVALEKLIFPILPQHLYQNANTLRNSGNEFIPVGTGRYSVSEYDYLKKLVLEPYDGYRGEKAQNTLIFMVVPGMAEAVNLLNINELSLVHIDDPDRRTMTPQGESAVTDYIEPELEMLAFSLRNRYLADKRVRQAIAYAFDAKEALETAYSSGGVLADDLYFPGYRGLEYDGDSFYGRDYSKARELLREAGVYEIGDAFPPLKILVRKSRSDELSAAGLLSSALVEIDLPFEIIEAEDEEYDFKMNYRDFEIAFVSYRMAAYFDLRPLLNSYNWNYAGYQNQELDALMESMMGPLAAEEKSAAAERIKEILTEDIPYYPYIFKTGGLISSEELRGELKPCFTNIYRGAEELYTMRPAEE